MVSIADVENTLNNSEFLLRSNEYNRARLIWLANRLGPQMKVISADRLQSLGRLPSFDEGLAEDAFDVTKVGSSVELFMVSHRWLNSEAGKPDDATNAKLASLLEFFAWRRRRIANGRGLKIYAWIDYCCFDQRNIDRDLTMLPLWVACCERILICSTSDYLDRAWCRLEMLLARAFQFADHHTSIPLGFKDREGYNGAPTTMTVPPPEGGKVTNVEDTPRIRQLSELAYRRLGRKEKIEAKLYDFAQ